VLFAEAFPHRFFDMGIAEQDMASTAAGLAASGLIPYANSFAIFVTSRCYDQVRTQIAYPALPVKLAGSSAGLTQGPDGASHQSLEAADLLARDRVEARVVNVSTLKPLDTAGIRAAAMGVQCAFTGEEHSIVGGLGSAVAEALAEREGGEAPPLRRLGVRDQFGESGLADELLEKHGLQPGGIYRSVIASLKGR